MKKVSGASVSIRWIPIGPCKTCRSSPISKVTAECSSCYFSRKHASRPKRAAVCKVCGPTESKTWYRDLCQKCYNMIPGVKAKRAARYRHLMESNHSLHLAYCDGKRRYFKTKKAAILAQRKIHRHGCPEARMANRWRAYLGNSIKRGRLGVRTPALFVARFGGKIQDAVRQIEARFKPGMSWGNWGHGGWHIDHMVPLAAFNLSLAESARAAFHYTNLSPEWSSENRRKGSLYNGRRWTYKDHLQPQNQPPQPFALIDASA